MSCFVSDKGHDIKRNDQNCAHSTITSEGGVKNGLSKTRHKYFFQATMRLLINEGKYFLICYFFFAIISIIYVKWEKGNI